MGLLLIVGRLSNEKQGSCWYSVDLKGSYKNIGAERKWMIEAEIGMRSRWG